MHGKQALFQKGSQNYPSHPSHPSHPLQIWYHPSHPCQAWPDIRVYCYMNPIYPNCPSHPSQVWPESAVIQVIRVSHPSHPSYLTYKSTRACSALAGLCPPGPMRVGTVDMRPEGCNARARSAWITYPSHPVGCTASAETSSGGVRPPGPLPVKGDLGAGLQRELW